MNFHWLNKTETKKQSPTGKFSQRLTRNRAEGCAILKGTAGSFNRHRLFCNFVLAGTLAGSCSASESIYLANGFCLQADSHERNATSIVLHTVGGTIEVKFDAIDHIEAAESKAVPPAPAGVPLSSEELLKRAALAQGLPLEFVRSVSKVESSLLQGAISPKGAIGLMQLMPATAAQLGVDPKEASQNAEGGAKYLRELLVRYHYDSVRALAAYNAGPGAVARAKGVPAIPETVHYVQRVLKEYAKQQAAIEETRKTGAVSSAPPSPFRFKTPTATN